MNIQPEEGKTFRRVLWSWCPPTTVLWILDMIKFIVMFLMFTYNPYVAMVVAWIYHFIIYGLSMTSLRRR